MTFKYSICHPHKKNIIYINDPISGGEVLTIAEKHPWNEQLNLLNDSNNQIHFSPTLEFICLENNRSLTLTATHDKKGEVEFSLWYMRQKKVKVLFGLLGEKEKPVLDDIWAITYENALKYLEHFVNGNYAVLEELYKK